MNTDSSPAKLPVRMRLGLPAIGSPPEDRLMPRKRNRKVKLKRNVMIGSRPDNKVKCCTSVNTSQSLYFLLLFHLLCAQHIAARFHPLLTLCVRRERATLAASVFVSVEIAITVMAFPVTSF